MTIKTSVVCGTVASVLVGAMIASRPQSVAFAAGLQCDVTQYKESTGLTAAVDRDLLAVTWAGQAGSEVRARSFQCFDDAGSLSVHIEEIVREAVPAHEGKISEDYAPPGIEICALVVLNSPASLFQRLVDVLARLIFRRRHGAQDTSFT